MADYLHDNVFDAALDYVMACTEAEVRASAESVLVDSITLDSGNFGSKVAGSPSGRRVQCLVSDSNDMKAIAVSSTGAAHHVTLLRSIGSAMTPVVHADLPSAVSLLSTDEVNLGTFYVQFPDAT